LEVVATIVGGLLLAGAIAAEQLWWDRHFLPVFFFSHHKYMLGEGLRARDRPCRHILILSSGP